jgi:hypothetical protein
MYCYATALRNGEALGLFEVELNFRLGILVTSGVPMG